MEKFDQATVIGEKNSFAPPPEANPTPEIRNEQTSSLAETHKAGSAAETPGRSLAEENRPSDTGLALAIPPIPEEPENIALRFRDEAKKVYDPDAPSFANNLFDFVELFIITLVAVLLLVCFVLRPSTVDGKSMQNTLQHGENLIISDLFYHPQRGDIVVFEDYTIGNYLKKPLVKRVIAVAGDEVEIRTSQKLVDGVYTTRGSVYINGEKCKEDYVYIDAGASDTSEYLKLTVPEGEVFVLGDHRNDSTDSRYFGCVSEDAILGKVYLRIYPFDQFGKVN